MIDFRYHVISIVAVFLALATGLVLGASLLNTQLIETQNSQNESLIVMVGAHFNLTEFHDKNRAGMSSTFLTRLRVGETLVDAKGVSRLYKPGLGGGSMALFGLAFVVIAVIVVIASPGLDNVFELLWLKISDALGI